MLTPFVPLVSTSPAAKARKPDGRMGRAPCLLLHLLPHRFGGWISRHAPFLHPRSLQEIRLHSLHPTKAPNVCHQRCFHPNEILWQDLFSEMGGCCELSQLHNPSSASNIDFCIPFLCFFRSRLLSPGSSVVVPCPSASLSGFHGGAEQSLGSLHTGSSLMLLCAEKETFPSGLESVC